MAYELLTGVRPFVGESMATVAHLIVYGPRPSARAANAALPPGADQVLERALSRFPAERFPNCTEFALALEKALQNASRRCLSPNAKATIEKNAGSRLFLYGGGFAASINCGVPVGIQLSTRRRRHHSRRPSGPVKVRQPKWNPPGSCSARYPSQSRPRRGVNLRLWYCRATRRPAPASARQAETSSRQPSARSDSTRARSRKRGQGKPEEARALFQQAAELGDAGAMNELAENLQHRRRSAAVVQSSSGSGKLRSHALTGRACTYSATTPSSRTTKKQRGGFRRPPI